MDTHHEKLSEEQVGAYLETYLQLKSNYNLVMYSLFIAYGGQGALYASLFQAQVGRSLTPLAFVIAGAPWFTYFFITFTRIPPLMPRAFRVALRFVIWSYVTNTVVLVGSAITGLIPTPLPHPGTTAFWVASLAGWLGIPTLYHFQGVLRRWATA